MKKILIGVDGGGTKTIVRVEAEGGELLGCAIGGPANIRISVSQAWESINRTITQILTPLNIALDDPKYEFQAGMGLAGCEVISAYEQFVSTPHHFKKLIVKSDAYTACLGAHAGEDGAIIIVGTGVAGFQIHLSETSRVSGWGFPHDDKGGGAWLGLQAVSETLCWCDGRSSESGLAKAVFAHFKNNLSVLVSWANHANSSQFAELAPIVIEQSALKDLTAIELMKLAAEHINALDHALLTAQIEKSNAQMKGQSDYQQRLPRVLLGGISPFIKDYLSPQLRAHLREPIAGPEVGALLLVKTSEKA